MGDRKVVDAWVVLHGWVNICEEKKMEKGMGGWNAVGWTTGILVLKLSHV